MASLIISIIGTLVLCSALIFIHVFLIKQAWGCKGVKRDKIIVTIMAVVALMIDLSLVIWKIWF